ncbi:Predicted PurR-regulated permease PerM [Halogeometricum rufum]|uniref:Predicted PurR-regulated permease PerM n=1 Tax=Halogeometricum rufum TaxID=553469 RepID=A0A1I6FWA3_9EURY|nr:AI-2E family transporter [Halogeometricum rufum]SFR34242.1 Predicted PurR-regulated permease PerM [Halogeometricum rufum]
MTLDRRYVFGGLFVLTGVAAAFLLRSVLGTVFFAVTVAYLLWPVRQALVRRGQSFRVASGVATVGALLAALLVLSPLVVVVYLRFDALASLLDLIPSDVVFELFGMTYRFTLAEVSTFAVAYLRRLATAAAAATPVLLVKATLFVFLVYSLLYHGEKAQRAALAVVPSSYQPAARALNERARDTLFAIYVLQAATAVGTFVLALPVFYLLGYEAVVTLATVAAVLQFVPILGPTLLLAGLAAYQLAIGQTVAALLVVFVGGAVVAWLPDVLIRPRLAQQTAHIPGSLYFVGFFGGALTLGAVGIVAGPLAVGLFVETASLLTGELHAVPVDDE